MKIEQWVCDLCGNEIPNNAMDCYDKTTDVVSEYRCDTTEGKKISGEVVLTTTVTFPGMKYFDVCPTCILKMMHKAKQKGK